MNLIINMPDSEYNELKGLYQLGLTTPVYKTIIEKSCVEAITNGTPLPKGHGELIDRDKLLPKIHGIKSIVATLDAPTVIKADESEDK